MIIRYQPPFYITILCCILTAIVTYGAVRTPDAEDTLRRMRYIRSHDEQAREYVDEVIRTHALVWQFVADKTLVGDFDVDTVDGIREHLVKQIEPAAVQAFNRYAAPRFENFETQFASDFASSIRNQFEERLQ